MFSLVLFIHIFDVVAIQCQTAALDELFDNSTECFQRYQTAHILLHSLAQTVNYQQDRQLLTKCESCTTSPAVCSFQV